MNTHERPLVERGGAGYHPRAVQATLCPVAAVVKEDVLCCVSESESDEEDGD